MKNELKTAKCRKKLEIFWEIDRVSGSWEGGVTSVTKVVILKLISRMCLIFLLITRIWWLKTGGFTSINVDKVSCTGGLFVGPVLAVWWPEVLQICQKDSLLYTSYWGNYRFHLSEECLHWIWWFVCLRKRFVQQA